jgi:Cu/Ag efflux protein CusF
MLRSRGDLREETNVMRKKMEWTLGLLLFGFVSLSTSAEAQKAVTQSDIVEITAKIQAIDRDARTVTLVDDDGHLETLVAGSQIKRFDDLKVGDTVTFRYYESIVSQVRKAGSAPPPKAEGVPTMVRGTGPKPSGTVSQQLTATVTIKAIDTKVPSLTVLGEDGHTMSFNLDDRKLIDGLAVGDHVDITYTAALVINVK